MSDGYGMFGVDAQRKEHPAIKSGKEDQGNVEGSLGSAKIDGQRLFMGAGGGQAMGAKARKPAGKGPTLNRATAGGFKVRKRK